MFDKEDVKTIDLEWHKMMLKRAVQYIKEGKKKFAPTTTNSDVDVFLKDYEKHTTPN